MKTVCVGRFAIDVPAEARVSLSNERLAGFEIATGHETEAAFQARVRVREAELAARPPATDGSGGIVMARDLRVAALAGRILVYGRNQGYVMEGQRRIDDDYVAVELHAHIGELSITLTAPYADEARADLGEALLARLRPRVPDELPPEPGFCIADAVFAEPLPVRKAETIALHVGLPEHPDVALAFALMAGGTTGRGLLARYGDLDAQAAPDELLRVSTLRRGRRAINGIGGEEVLERVREFNFATTYGFVWEAPGVRDDALQPFVSLELHGGISPRAGGKPVDTSLHEDAVLALWERISSSIRVRPTGPVAAQSGSPTGPQSGPPLGSTATAGAPCPQAGWWTCGDASAGVAVQGGAVQWLRGGARMPQALLLPRATLWQKLRGLQPSIEPARATTWTLLDRRLRPRTPAVVALAPAGPVTAGADGQAMADRAPDRQAMDRQVTDSLATDRQATNRQATNRQGTDRPALAQAATDQRAPTGQATQGGALGSGASARTGDACPASGWWRCEDAQALDGARWFAAGSVLPPATFRVAAVRSDRGVGLNVIQRPGNWQLLRRADADSAAPAARSL